MDPNMRWPKKASDSHTQWLNYQMVWTWARTTMCGALGTFGCGAPRKILFLQCMSIPTLKGSKVSSAAIWAAAYALQIDTFLFLLLHFLPLLETQILVFRVKF